MVHTVGHAPARVDDVIVSAPHGRSYAVRRHWLPWRQRIPVDTILLVTVLAGLKLALRVALVPVVVLLRLLRVLPWELEVRDLGARRDAAVVSREQVRGWSASRQRIRALVREVQHQSVAPVPSGFTVVLTRDSVSMGDDADDNSRVLVLDDRTAHPTVATLVTAICNGGRWVSIARHTTLEVLRRSGAWDHHQQRAAVPDLHQVLITEPSSRAHARHGAGEIWGVRAQESRGRAALYANALRAETARSCSGCCTSTTDQRRRHGGVVRRLDGTVALGPIWDWKTEQVWSYLARHQLPVNPVYDKLRRLGAPEHFLRVSHMLDGSRLEEGRVTWLRRGWPDLFEELDTHLPRLREFV